MRDNFIRTFFWKSQLQAKSLRSREVALNCQHWEPINALQMPEVYYPPTSRLIPSVRGAEMWELSSLVDAMCLTLCDVFLSLPSGGVREGGFSFPKSSEWEILHKSFSSRVRVIQHFLGGLCWHRNWNIHPWPTENAEYERAHGRVGIVFCTQPRI